MKKFERIFKIRLRKGDMVVVTRGRLKVKKAGFRRRFQSLIR